MSQKLLDMMNGSLNTLENALHKMQSLSKQLHTPLPLNIAGSTPSELDLIHEMESSRLLALGEDDLDVENKQQKTFQSLVSDLCEYVGIGEDTYEFDDDLEESGLYEIANKSNDDTSQREQEKQKEVPSNRLDEEASGSEDEDGWLKKIDYDTYNTGENHDVGGVKEEDASDRSDLEEGEGLGRKRQSSALETRSYKQVRVKGPFNAQLRHKYQRKINKLKVDYFELEELYRQTLQRIEQFRKINRAVRDAVIVEDRSDAEGAIADKQGRGESIVLDEEEESILLEILESITEELPNFSEQLKELEALVERREAEFERLQEARSRQISVLKDKHGERKAAEELRAAWMAAMKEHEQLLSKAAQLRNEEQELRSDLEEAERTLDSLKSAKDVSNSGIPADESHDGYVSSDKFKELNLARERIESEQLNRIADLESKLRELKAKRDQRIHQLKCAATPASPLATRSYPKWASPALSSRRRSQIQSGEDDIQSPTQHEDVNGTRDSLWLNTSVTTNSSAQWDAAADIATALETLESTSYSQVGPEEKNEQYSDNVVEVSGMGTNLTQESGDEMSLELAKDEEVSEMLEIINRLEGRLASNKVLESMHKYDTEALKIASQRICQGIAKQALLEVGGNTGISHPMVGVGQDGPDKPAFTGQYRLQIATSAIAALLAEQEEDNKSWGEEAIKELAITSGITRLLSIGDLSLNEAIKRVTKHSRLLLNTKENAM